MLLSLSLSLKEKFPHLWVVTTTKRLSQGFFICQSHNTISKAHYLSRIVIKENHWIYKFCFYNPSTTLRIILFGIISYFITYQCTNDFVYIPFFFVIFFSLSHIYIDSLIYVGDQTFYSIISISVTIFSVSLRLHNFVNFTWKTK